jgi:hypothetical protein
MSATRLFGGRSAAPRQVARRHNTPGESQAQMTVAAPSFMLRDFGPRLRAGATGPCCATGPPAPGKFLWPSAKPGS